MSLPSLMELLIRNWSDIPRVVKSLSRSLPRTRESISMQIRGKEFKAACVSMITGSSPSQRLVKIRRRKKRTRDEMFSELMLSSHTDRAQTNAWRQTMSECRKAQNDREERWWAEERAKAERWRQCDERRQDSMLRLLEDQTNMLQHMVELQERQQEHRPPLQPLCNQPPSEPSSIASTPRRPRMQWGASGHPATPPQRIAQATEGWHSISFKILNF
ncbi:uncharacterized protein LOC142072579 [Caretta caretta]|uniref:uncharacterized protein LOC142072579 n=1 Tax=Caretta caretta TaxID=8467 RepID=UPI003F4C3452